MPSFTWGGNTYNATSTTYYNNNFVYQDGIAVPSTRLAYNGTRPIRITAVGFAYYAGATGVYGNVNYQNSGNIASGTWVNSGGTTRVVLGYAGGPLTFGRNTAFGGTVIDAADGIGFASGTLAGIAYYHEAPSAPLSVTATPSSSVVGRIVVSWSAPSDNGGTAITGYDVYRGGTLVGSTSSTSINADGLTPGTSYTFTVRAKNSLTTAVGTTGVASSASSAAVAPGPPTAPQSLTATASTSVTGRINLSWSAPATPGTGGITGYNIFRNGTQIATTSGTGTTYASTGLTPYTTYTYEVRARNAFGDANIILSAASNSDSAVAPGPPGAPTGLTAIADGGTAGKIDLSWTAPSVTGTGGITGYKIYFSTGSLITSQNGTGTTYSVLGLNPGQTYSFYVRARNALSDAEGSHSAQSNTATAQALGEPAAPTGLTATASTSIPGRITLSWSAPGGTLTGYTVLERDTVALTDTVIGITQGTTFKIDNLPGGITKTYRIRARNSYTDTLSDGYPGNYGGAASSTASATPVSNYSLSIPTTAGVVSNTTNTTFNGTYTINAITPTTVRYAKTSANVTSVSASGTVTDNTNATFNGTYTIASSPTPSTFTYAKTASNIPSTAMSGGTITNNTNVTFNGTYSVTAVNVGAKTVSYAKTASNISSRSVPINALPGGVSTVTNNTNAVYNGTNITITAVTPLTISYAKTNANIAESNAAGMVTNITNRDEYNGTWIVSALPTYNTLVFTSGGADQASTAVPALPAGQVERTVSPAQLDIKYRSGWTG